MKLTVNFISDSYFYLDVKLTFRNKNKTIEKRDKLLVNTESFYSTIKTLI